MDNTIEFVNPLITKEEFFKLTEACRRDGEIDETEVEKLVQWVTKVRTAHWCAELLLEGFLKLEKWNDAEPDFLPTESALEFMEMSCFNKLFSEEPMYEESKC